MTPRRLAVKALIHQEQAGYANLVLDAELKKCTPPLDSRDAAFAARIFYTTLERLPLLDYRINQFTKKPVAKLDAPVRAVLRAGLAQALYMNVPLPAAVNESVKLTRALGKSSAAGMVNAVLRRAAAADVSEADFADPLDRLSIYYCLSRPVAELFYAQFGAEAFPLAAAFYEKPKTTIRVNTLRTNDTDLTALLQNPLVENSNVHFPPRARHSKKVFSMCRGLPASLPRSALTHSRGSRCSISAPRRAAKA